MCARIDDRLTYQAPFFGEYSFDRLTAVRGGAASWRTRRSLREWRMNNMGFRGRDLKLAKDRPRIVVLGASESFGIYEAPGKEYPAQLERI